MSKKNKNHLLDSILNIFKFIKSSVYFSGKNIESTTKIFWVNAFLALVMISIFSVKNTHFYFLGKGWEKLFNHSIEGVVRFTDLVPWYIHFIFLFIMMFLLFAMILGVPSVKVLNNLNLAIRQIGLKNSVQQFVEVKNIERFNQDRFYVEFKAKGVSREAFQKKSGNLKSAVNSQVESISEKDGSPGIIEVIFNKKPLTKDLKYQNVCAQASKPGEIVIGTSKSGILTENISTFPHMLVAGSSGYGKSNFLKQMTVNLLENTENLQVYVFDFKEGISFKPFMKLPNVKIYTDIFSSNTILDQLREEMKERLKLTSNTSDEVIDLKKHKKDQILIIVDECSMLFTPSKHDKNQKKISIKATELCDEIAKLGRAARFNLVLGNQRIVKETIDTRIQENLMGRICFKLPSISGSNNVLNNKSAAILPNIKGRAIYNFNAINEEVQAPYIDSNELKRRVEQIAKDFKDKKRKTNSSMLGDVKSLPAELKKTSRSVSLNEKK